MPHVRISTFSNHEGVHVCTPADTSSTFAAQRSQSGLPPEQLPGCGDEVSYCSYLPPSGQGGGKADTKAGKNPNSMEEDIENARVPWTSAGCFVCCSGMQPAPFRSKSSAVGCYKCFTSGGGEGFGRTLGSRRLLQLWTKVGRTLGY